MPPRSWLRPLVVVALALPGGVRTQATTPTVVLLDTARLQAPRLGESSGVVASRRRPGVFWTHNDSGDDPVLYATDSSGADLGFVRLSGATHRDWEDIAAGPCVRTPRTCLYVGDTGDNGARRPSIVVYRVEEPRPPAEPADTLRTVPVLDSIVLRYPDRPRDAEGLAITPDGWLLLVGKDRIGPALLFRARLPRTAATRTLESVGALALETNLVRGRIVTAADISPNGLWLAVRTYVSVHLFRLDGAALPRPVMPQAGAAIPVVERQGEGLAFDGNDRLVLTSERAGGDAILTRLRLVGLEP